MLGFRFSLLYKASPERRRMDRNSEVFAVRLPHPAEGGLGSRCGMSSAQITLDSALLSREQAEHSDAVAGDFRFVLVFKYADVLLPPEVPHSLPAFYA